jgi:hypothetical protein
MSSIGLEKLAAQTPNFTLEGVDELETNKVLKFFVGSFIYIALECVQLFLRKMVLIWFPFKI